VDIDLKQLFWGIELPRDMLDIEKELKKIGEKPSTDTAKRRALAEISGAASRPGRSSAASRAGPGSRTGICQNCSRT
jgi:transcription initiation factor TFIIE subunit beta